MALVNCPECLREISSEAVACPGCGHPMREVEPVKIAEHPAVKSLKVVALLCVVLALFLAGIGNCGSPVTLSADISATDYVLVVTNGNDVEWHDARFRINDSYDLEILEVVAGQEVRLPLKDFTDGDGRRFDPTRSVVRTVHVSATIRGREGTYAGRVRH